MNMKSNLSLLVLLSSLPLSNPTALAQGNSPGAIVPDKYIVELRPGAAAAPVVARHGLAPDFVFSAAINGFAGFIPPGQLRKLETDPEVALVTPDREVTAFAKPAGGAIARQPQVTPAGVQRIGADLLFDQISAAGVGVAVVDTGLDTSHPDLVVSGKMYSSIARATGKDDNGHGTHVGGIIAAKNDGYDVVGVAPGATLYAVKVLNRSGSGTDSTVIAGLDWVAQYYSSVTPNIRVVNMSLGRPGSLNDNPAYRNALARLQSCGITVVVAAGNTCSAEIDGMVPACYPEALAVASTTARDGASSYTGFNGIPMDTASFFTTDGKGVAVSAPGEDQENVSSTGTISSLGILSTKMGGGTTRMSGTSMASPHVAGVAALVYAAHGNITPDKVRAKISTTALGLGAVPLASPTSCYSADGVAEGVVSAADAIR